MRGLDGSNMTSVESDNEVIVIDQLMSAETAAAAVTFFRQHRGERAVTSVSYTHTHIDHVSGVLGVVSAHTAVPIIAPEHFLDHAAQENDNAAAKEVLSAILEHLSQCPENGTGRNCFLLDSHELLNPIKQIALAGAGLTQAMTVALLWTSHILSFQGCTIVADAARNAMTGRATDDAALIVTMVMAKTLSPTVRPPDPMACPAAAPFSKFFGFRAERRKPRTNPRAAVMVSMAAMIPTSQPKRTPRLVLLAFGQKSIRIAAMIGIGLIVTPKAREVCPRWRFPRRLQFLFFRCGQWLSRRRGQGCEGFPRGGVELFITEKLIGAHSLEDLLAGAG